jgi:hypothetical protein
LRLLSVVLALGVTAVVTSKASDKRHYSLNNRYNSNYTATWTAINGANSSITSMQTLINNLFTKIGDPLQNGSGLTDSQSTFLATLGAMGNVGHPAGGDLTSTNTQLDDLLNELATQNYMLP